MHTHTYTKQAVNTSLQQHNKCQDNFERKNMEKRTEGKKESQDKEQ